MQTSVFFIPPLGVGSHLGIFWNTRRLFVYSILLQHPSLKSWGYRHLPSDSWEEHEFSKLWGYYPHFAKLFSCQALNPPSLLQLVNSRLSWGVMDSFSGEPSLTTLRLTKLGFFYSTPSARSPGSCVYLMSHSVPAYCNSLLLTFLSRPSMFTVAWFTVPKAVPDK